MKALAKALGVSCLLLLAFSACGDDDGGGDGNATAGEAGAAGTRSGSGGSAAQGGLGGEGTGGADGTSGESGAGMAGDAATGGSAGARGGSSGMGGRGGTDGTAADGGVAGAGDGGSSGDVGDGGTGGSADTPPVNRECDAPADCDRTRGASPCGAWACNTQGACVADSPGCTDADGDGYGAGSSCACAALDCDDQDASIGSIGRRVCSLRSGSRGGCVSTVRLCYGGTWGECREAPGEVPPGGEACNGEDDDCDGDIDEGLGVFSCGFGACRTVVPACTAGVIRRCLPRAPTTTVDGCNGIDDDCDGSTDEDCADCLHVAPDGDDTVAAQDAGATPFQNLQPALDFAASHPEAPSRVCVAAGPACGASATYPGPMNADLVMRNGIALVGGYESTTWTRCSNSVTLIAPTTARGVFFPSDIDEPTVFDGFTVDRLAATTTAGVTLDGARGVVLVNLVITNTPLADYSYGVDVVNGSEATILRSNVNGGASTVESIGVRSVASRVMLEDNCSSFDAATGRCRIGCTDGINGRATLGGGFSAAVVLRASPSSRIERSSICAQGQTIGESTPNRSRIAAILIEGDGTGIVMRGNMIQSDTRNWNVFASTIRAENCGGATPWLIDNTSISGVGQSASTIESIVSSGDCHVVIDSNASISAHRQPPARSRTIRCTSSGNVASRCVISNNRDVHSTSVLPPLPLPGSTNHAVGIRCEAGACAKIVKNSLYASKFNGCSMGCRGSATAVELDRSGAFIDSNVFSAGCPWFGAGLIAVSSWSRIQNNTIAVHSDDCPTWPQPLLSSNAVLDVTSDALGDELDVHSNSIRVSSVGSFVATCFVGVRAAASPPDGPRGIFRNNALAGGSAVGIAEMSATADPRIVQNNLFSLGTYADADGLPSNTIAEINALTDIIASGNVADGDDAPNGGTPEGAPLWDQNGRPRGAQPDIGATEFQADDP